MQNTSVDKNEGSSSCNVMCSSDVFHFLISFSFQVKRKLFVVDLKGHTKLLLIKALL